MATAWPRFDRYEVRGVLGRGGFAVVYRAFDRVLGREVALKVLRDELADEPQAADRFLREARRLAQLRHPNIVTVFDVGEAAGAPFFTMELIEGTTLATLVASQRGLPLSRVVSLLRPLAAAIDYLHGHGVIHRDIKAANVMLSHEDQVVLMDFGIARVLEEVGTTLTGQSLGTPEAMAPEQIRGEAIGPPADIYALGVLAYRLLAGRPPFVGPIQQVIVAHLQQEPPPLADASPELPEHAIAAVESALAKDAKFRPGSATAFVDALAAPGPQYALHAAAVGDDGPRFVAAAAVRRPQTAVPTATPAGRAPVFRRRSAGRGAVIGSVAIAIAAATLYAANRNGHGSGNRTVALVPQATVPATGVAAAQRTASVAAISPSPSAVHTSAPSSLAGSAPTSATASSTPSPCAVGGASQAGRSVPPPPPPPASSSGAGSATAQAGSATAFSLQLAAPTLAAVGQDATLTAVPSPNAPGDLAYTWSFDDGTTATGGPSVTHAFASPGTYVITVTGVSAGTGVAAHAQTITVVVSATATPAAAASAGVTVTYPAGWNLVAGPEGTMFTQSTSPLYTFTAGASSYAVVPCMQGVHAAQGYWAYFASPATVQLGAGSDGQFTATLPAGQFITIGNPSPDKPVDLQGADLVYTYDPNAGYRATTTLAPGQGAWAYSRAGGVLTLRSR